MISVVEEAVHPLRCFSLAEVAVQKAIFSLRKEAGPRIVSAAPMVKLQASPREESSGGEEAVEALHLHPD